MTNQRYSTTVTSVAVGTTVGASGVIRYGNFDSGMVYVPAGSTITTLTWHVCETEDGTYLAAENESSTAITTTAGASQAFPIPAALRGARFIKCTGANAGVIGVTLKD